jgi:hypothetical protein
MYMKVVVGSAVGMYIEYGHGFVDNMQEQVDQGSSSKIWKVK